ncbi:unnamed protein product [Boreogadus saida]
MSGAETTAEAADVSEGDSAWNGGGDRSGSGRSLQLSAVGPPLPKDSLESNSVSKMSMALGGIMESIFSPG